jgi:hypothetical protein
MPLAVLAPSGASPFELDQPRALRRLHLREARKLAGWKSLSPNAKHVNEHLVRLSNTHAQVFKNERDVAKLIPPAPTKRRPNKSGQIHRSTLRNALDELQEAGLWSFWWTKGKRLGSGLRTSPIKVWQLHRTAFYRAWATLKHSLRRNMYQVKTEAYSLGKSGRLSRVVGRRKEPYLCRDSSKVPDWADYCVEAKPKLELRRNRHLIEVNWGKACSTSLVEW